MYKSNIFYNGSCARIVGVGRKKNTNKKQRRPTMNDSVSLGILRSSGSSLKADCDDCSVDDCESIDCEGVDCAECDCEDESEES